MLSRNDPLRALSSDPLWALRLRCCGSLPRAPLRTRWYVSSIHLWTDDLLHLRFCLLCSLFAHLGFLMSPNEQARRRGFEVRCNECRAKFEGRKSVRTHGVALDHQWEPPIQCLECGQGFRRQKLYELHLPTCSSAPQGIASITATGPAEACVQPAPAKPEVGQEATLACSSPISATRNTTGYSGKVGICTSAWAKRLCSDGLWLGDWMSVCEVYE
ncbi:hypothetical protein PYCCODRAFT_12060 [Trametes coccinea BRFM310]|uniref:C2H2-type domain-containing protein n=1 Tax=Trametes coccinea (strain BRFM310) TaxID=1353009 RepID=A0A1Y2J4J2_TRAC3|nr:hypothetical protein PYCCODRAFT_12060 [Trametes coccinea BRFM310]